MPGSSLYVESIKLGEMDIYGREFDVWDASLPIRVNLALGGGWIRGTVESSNARTVVLVEAENSAETRQNRMYPISGSRFEIGPLRPGDYYVFAVDRPTPFLLTDDLRRTLLRHAEKVQLGRNVVSTLSLKVIPVL